jgi:hypothetical protein
MREMVKIVCMGYVKEDGSNFICPADLGEKEIAGGGVTHGICQSCLAITLEMLKK